MAKKKRDKKPESKKNPGNKPEPIDDEKPFDFGGLPKRDLKKNLGC